MGIFEFQVKYAIETNGIEKASKLFHKRFRQGVLTQEELEFAEKLLYEAALA